MVKLRYLAYGSNLHPYRLEDRVSFARPLGVVPMANHQVTFHKRSVDGSGKCNLFQNESAQSYGVLYEFDASHVENLHRAEGLGQGYRRMQTAFTLEGKSYLPFLYVAESASISESLAPYHWYKDFVLLGAEYHNFPDIYLAELKSVPSLPDPNVGRAKKNTDLLTNLKRFPRLSQSLPWVKDSKTIVLHDEVSG